MSRTRQTKAKEPIKIRYRELANGNTGISLAHWNGSKWEYEFLKMYLVPETSKEAKRQNDETLRAVKKIQADRISSLLSDKAGLKAYKRNSVLLADYVDTYVEQNESGKAKGWKCFILSAKNVLLEYKGNKVYLKDVNKAFVKGFNAFLLTEYKTTKGKCIKQKSARAYSHTLSSILNGALRDGLIDKNPYVELTTADKISDTDSKLEHLTTDEVKTLIQTECKRDMIKHAFLFACFCGLRMSDVKQLKWSNITTNGNTMQIEKRQQKTKNVVYIPLSQHAVSFLPQRNDGTGDGLVFDGLPSPPTIEKVLRKWTETAGISKHVTFHVARHTYATLSLTAGTDFYTVSKLLGHTNVKTTQIYAKIVDQKKREAMEQLDNLFND